MPLVIKTEDGVVYKLPEALALDDHEMTVETPGVEIPRRHGIYRLDKHKEAQPRRLTLSGTIKGMSRADANKLAEELNTYLIGGGVLKLKRSPDSDQYIYCEAREIRHNPHRGHFGAKVFTLNITLEALDPWWYLYWQGALYETEESGESWTYNHAGTSQEQPTIVHIMPVEGAEALVNPKLTCAETGDVLQFNGTIGQDQVLVADCQAKTAVLYGYADILADILLGSTGESTKTNVWSQMNPSWQVYGFRLIPGDNIITYADDETSSHIARVYIEHKPRCW